MKRVLTACLGLFAAASVALAQESVPATGITPSTIPLPTRQNLGPVSPVGPFGDVAEESAYVWLSRHYSRISEDQTFDSNTVNLYVPLNLGKDGENNSVEVRGMGQMFVPGVFDAFFSGLATNGDTSKLIINPDLRDVYYNQFAGAQGFTIDSVVTNYFKNPYNFDPLTAPGKVYIWSTPANFNSTTFFTASTYQQNGFVIGRSSLVPKFETELSQQGLDTTLNEDKINAVKIVFDPPLEFAPGSAAIAMYVNDDAPAVDTPSVNENDHREFQIFRCFRENIEGTRRLDDYKTMGVAIRRAESSTFRRDTVISLWRFLIFPGPPETPANLDMSMTFSGSVDLQSGVSYHFGTDAKEQGITAISPNPAREAATVSFALKQPASVSIDLYDGQGNLVRHIVETPRYVPGNYSYTVQTGDLPAGNYLVRLTADGAGYSSKFTVVK